jgi:hypothetical protein
MREAVAEQQQVAHDVPTRMMLLMMMMMMMMMWVS